MAYATGSYTGINDAADLFYAWALTNGWAQLYSATSGTGKRYHISKTIEGTARFFNFATSAGGGWFANHYDIVGIGINGSTEFTGSGTPWSEQVGFTTAGYSSTTDTCGVLDELKPAGGGYHFFATATTLTAVFESESYAKDWRMVTIGTLGGYLFYSASGGQEGRASGDYADSRSVYLAHSYSYSQGTNPNMAVRVGGAWYLPYAYHYLSTNRTLMPILVTKSSPSTNVAGSLASALVHYSPDSFKGNAQLAPSSLGIVMAAEEFSPIADIEGVKLINMTNYTNGQEITYEGDTYKVFRIFNLSQVGVAFLK